jgi:hypothetical protein
MRPTGLGPRNPTPLVKLNPALRNLACAAFRALAEGENAA